MQNTGITGEGVRHNKNSHISIMDVLAFPATVLTTLCGSVSAMLPASNLLPTSDAPLNDQELGGYVATVVCLILCIFMILKMPFKTPPILLACCCSLSSCSTSTSRIAKDVQRRMASSSETTEVSGKEIGKKM